VAWLESEEWNSYKENGALEKVTGQDGLADMVWRAVRGAQTCEDDDGPALERGPWSPLWLTTVSFLPRLIYSTISSPSFFVLRLVPVAG